MQVKFFREKNLIVFKRKLIELCIVNYKIFNL
jgi:hypothetical protein